MGVEAIAGAVAAPFASKAIGGLLGGSKGNNGTSYGPGTAPVYTPQAQPQFDQYYQNIINQMMQPQANFAQTQLPQYQQTSSNIYNNPSLNMTRSAQEAGADMKNVGNLDLSNMQSLFGLANQEVPYGNQILQSAFDPQSALFNRTKQQLTDQTRSALEARGLDTSGMGAGIEGQTLSNFDIDWQNNLLNRMLTGVQGYGNVSNNVSSLYAGGGNLGAAGASLVEQGGALPYNTRNQVYQNQLGGLDAMTKSGQNAQQIPQNIINDLQSYLKLGQSGSSLANNAAGTGFGNSSQIGSDIGQLAGTLFGGGSGGNNGLPQGATDLGNNMPWLQPQQPSFFQQIQGMGSGALDSIASLFG